MRLTNSQARQLGIKVPRAKRNRTQKDAFNGKGGPRKPDQRGRNVLFEKLCLSHGLPVPVAEYPWGEAVGRKWRADWLFDAFVIVEQVGGVWTGGHHSGGQSQIDDMERRNSAQILGYIVLEFTPQQFEDGSAFVVIKEAMQS